MHSGIFCRSSILLVLLVIAQAVNAQESSLLGFADVNYVVSEADRPEGFDLGQLAGHAALGLSDRVAVFTEVSLTGGSDGYAVEVERLLLRYDFADYLKLSAGRYHTPISYWNTAYHHGLWLQTTVDRPRYTRFGSAFIPVHFVGLLGEGSLPSSPLGFGYFAGIGNGRGAQITRAGDQGDVNDSRAWLAGVYVRPESVYGLEAGAAVYRDRIEIDPVPGVDETIYAVHLAWEKERPEFLTEYARVHHDLDGGDDHWSSALYLQAAYRLHGAARPFKPYARYEWIDSPAEDPIFGPRGLDYDAIVAGVRYDFARQAALKVEYRSESFENSDRVNSFFLQASFSFPGTDVGLPFD